MLDTYFMNKSEEEILAEAAEKGYTIRDAPAHYARPGHRVGGTRITTGPDLWMNAVNARLWEIQRQEAK